MVEDDGAGIEADEEVCRRHVENGTAAVTALVEEIGYDEDIFGRPDETRLAAYYTADSPVSPAALREHLAERSTS